MKSLGEIYWDIDHECREKNISLCDEDMMLFHAAEKYVEELEKHGDRWESIVKNDIDYLNASSIGRSRVGQKGYREGAEIFLNYIRHELERYGLVIDVGVCYPEIPQDLISLFLNDKEKCVAFVKSHYREAPQFIAHAYLGESRVIDPSDTKKDIPVIAILFDYFVRPFTDGKKINSARTTFYRYFKP